MCDGIYNISSSSRTSFYYSDSFSEIGIFSVCLKHLEMPLYFDINMLRYCWALSSSKSRSNFVSWWQVGHLIVIMLSWGWFPICWRIFFAHSMQIESLQAKMIGNLPSWSIFVLQTGHSFGYILIFISFFIFLSRAQQGNTIDFAKLMIRWN